MTIKRILQHLKQNGGATLTARLNNYHPASGYAVSDYGTECRIPFDSKLFNKTIKQFKKHAKKLNKYIGLWVDDNGQICFDLSNILNNQEEAEQLARNNKQEAYFNFTNDKTIYIK